MIHRSRVYSAAVRGVDAEPVLVEVLLDAGLPGTSILGLPDSSVRESRDRVKAAIHSSGFDFPRHKILVNLAPAHTKKEGPWFDLPIALAILAAGGALPRVDLGDSVFVGELALDGTVRPVRGALSIAMAARAHGWRRLYVAPASAPLAALVGDLEVRRATDLRSLVKILTGGAPPEIVGPEAVRAIPIIEREDDPRWEDVIGQRIAKRALMLAAAGGHNLLFVGSPGAGKSMLAQRLPAVLPPPTLEEALEITKIYDLLSPGVELARRRPFRAPHHTTSRAGLVGGGPDLRPGEISLAHGGVLFLDELAEFQRDTLDALRQPLEEGRITIGRAVGSLTFPARFQLVAAMNPCPCGWRGHPIRPCVCLPRDLSRYQVRVSGPLLDRIDLFLAVAPVESKDLARAPADGETRAARETVIAARDRQIARYQESRSRPAAPRGSAPVNARLRGKALDKICAIDGRGRGLLERAMDRFGLTMRARGRTLRVARTIADLEGKDSIGVGHVAEALSYRLATDSASGAVE